MKAGPEYSIKKAIAAIRRAKKIIIVSHVNPDGDTIGCLLALGLSLLQIGKKVTLLSQDGVPTRFQFLPGSELILSETTETAEVAIAVDCGGAGQLGSAQKAFFRAKTTIQIDHHDFGTPFGKIQILENEAAAVGEIVYEIIVGLKVEISPAIATCLLTSIIIDTGSFRFSNIRAKTFDICGKLIKRGVDLQHLIEESYWTKSPAMMRLSSHALLNAQYSQDGTVTWSVVYQKDLKRYGANISDADAVADDLRSVEGVRIAAVFRETEKGSFRVSLRSKHGINIALVAKEFNGGGHHNSAGCGIKPSEKEKLLERLESLIHS